MGKGDYFVQKKALKLNAAASSFQIVSLTIGTSFSIEKIIPIQIDLQKRKNSHTLSS